MSVRLKINRQRAAADVVKTLTQLGHQSDYINFHRERFAFLWDIISSVQSQRSCKRLLDVGPYYQTVLWRSVFFELVIDTLGFDQDINRARSGEKHIHLDLNHCLHFNMEGHQEAYDLIVFSEVIEHLYTKPEIILSFLKAWLKPKGLLILQTPNAVALDKRLKILLGRNPYQLIEEHRMNHFREYTMQELKHISTTAGYALLHASCSNYFTPDQTVGQKIYHRLGPLLPASWRDGLTLVLQPS